MKKIKTHKVVMLPTKKASNINLCNYSNTLSTKTGFEKKECCSNQHLYIISDNEIKEGDWNYCTEEKRLKQYFINDKPINGLCGDCCKKIVATTDKSLIFEGDQIYPLANVEYKVKQIPESFIQAYIKAYNEGKPITEVDLEMMYDCLNNTTCKDKQCPRCGIMGAQEIIKTRSDNTVIIHQSKMYSRDEVIKLLEKYESDAPNKRAKFIEENL